MSPDGAVRLILDEIDQTNSPLPVAAACSALGINPFHIAENQVRLRLLTVRDSDRLRLERSGTADCEVIPESVSVDNHLDELYRSPACHPDPLEMLKPGRTDRLAADRVEAMKRVVICRA